MKKIFLSTCLAALFVVACTKSEITKPATVTSVAAEASSVTAAQGNLALLTGKTWIYMRYFVNYTDTINYGSLAYKRGNLNNTIILDNNTVKFNADGTVEEYTNAGEYVPGTWSFLNDTQTSMVVYNSYGTFYSNILKLNNNKLIWNDPNARTTGVMEPK